MKSPILILNDFISPLQCETIIEDLGSPIPNISENGVPLKTTLYSRLIENRLRDPLMDLADACQDYYGYTHKGIGRLEIELYASGYKTLPPACENSIYREGKWLRSNERDIAGVIFLSDFRDKPPIDTAFEVNGGKLEFTSQEFSVTPKRGTVVVFPGGPNFINTTSRVKKGDLYQVRFYFAASKPYTYNRDDFPGDYTTWFSTGT